MNKQLSKRAIEGRRWRIKARETRKLNVVISKYVEEKHPEIYEKCKNFYNKVVNKYEDVQNLTKTKEFQFFLMGIGDNSNEATEKAATEEGISNEATEKAATEEGISNEATEKAATEEGISNEATEKAATEEGISNEATEKTSVVEDHIDLLTETICESGINNDDILLDDMDTFVNNLIREMEATEPSIFNSELKEYPFW